jgi:predicted DsbA family dithiol-disulfide isomerase
MVARRLMNTNEITQKQITLDIYSDVVCPWCYIGLKRLEAAKTLAPDYVTVDIAWRAYQLDPTVPTEGYDFQSHLAAKFGGKDQMLAKFDHVRETGRSVGIAFDFANMKYSPNTLNAHRLIRSVAHDRPLQDAVVKRLFQAFFEEGFNIGDIEVLANLAEDCGMDKHEIAEILGSSTFEHEVKTEIANASRMGISGVPCFIFEQKYAVSGAQAPETLANAIAQIAEAKANGQLESAA